MNSKNESCSSPSVSIELSINLGYNEQYFKVELPSITPSMFEIVSIIVCSIILINVFLFSSVKLS